MTTEELTFLLLGIIILVFLIDILIKKRKKSLETGLEKFKEKENIKKKIIKRVAVIIASLAILFLVYSIIITYPSLIYNYDKLDIKINNKNEVFDLSSNDFGKVYFEINKPYNKAELVISIEGKKSNTLYDNYGSGFSKIDLFNDMSKRTKRKIISKLVSGDKIQMSINFNVIGGISNDEILAQHTQSYSFTPNIFATYNLPQIIEVNGSNFAKQYSKISKEELINKILDDNFVKPYNLKEPKIIRKENKITVSVKVDKIYEYSFLLFHHDWEKFSAPSINYEDGEEHAYKTNIRRNSDDTYTLSRDYIFESTDMELEKVFYTDIVLHNYDSEGIDHMVLIGSLILDNQAPKVSTYFNCFADDNEVSGCVSVYSESWRGKRKPFKVKVKGDISKIYINGFKISFDKEKAKKEELDLYKVLYFYTDFGHYRWPIKVVDLRGNVTESYIEGEAVSAD